jgi:hypothetical protein
MPENDSTRLQKKLLIAQIVLAVATIALVGVAFWYALETRALRNNAEQQLALIRKQFRLSIIPDLFPSVVSREVMVKEINEGSIKVKTKGGKVTKERLLQIVKHGVIVRNVSDRIAYDVYAFVYDTITKSYMKSDYHQAFIKGAAHGEFFYVNDDYINEDQLKARIRDIIGKEPDSVMKNLFLSYLRTLKAILFLG